MKILFLLFFTICSQVYAKTAQDSINISGHFTGNTRFAKVLVKKFEVGTFDILIVPIVEEKFSIKVPADIQPGIYRFQYSQTDDFDYLDIIIDGKEKNISFELDLKSPKSLPNFLSSVENKNWYNYKMQSTNILFKIEVLNQAVSYYPNIKDTIFEQMEKALAAEIKNYDAVFGKFILQNKDTWTGNMISSSRFYFINPKDDFRIQDYNRKNHFWDYIDASNPKMINTPLYTESILNYLRYYMNPAMKFSEEEMNQGFISSVDIIMNKFSGNKETQNFAVKYLQMGFREIGNELVLRHLDEAYAAVIEQCQDETVEKEQFQIRMAGYEALKVGNAAPNSILHLKDNDIKNLYEIKNDKIILAFWASWCPNCENQMPEVEKYAKANKNVSVIAVSLDDNLQEYNNAIAGYPNLIHSCDLAKWESKIISDYYIYGSPTFIVLDKNHSILGKYSSWETALQVL